MITQTDDFANFLQIKEIYDEEQDDEGHSWSNQLSFHKHINLDIMTRYYHKA